MTLEEILSVRPSPGEPRPYVFPGFERVTLPSGLQVLTVDLPGRPLVSASLVVRRGAYDEPAAKGGATVLAARALTEGSERYPGLELIETAERLGATLHAEANWDAFGASVDVAAARLPQALELLAELVERPRFPAEEVDRLREERLNELLQIKADPRRRADQAFTASIYPPEAPYARPAGGDDRTVPGLTRDDLVAVHGTLLAPDRAALVVGGDLSGLDVVGLAERVFGSFGEGGTAAPPVPPAVAPARAPTFVRLLDRPGSVQSEIRIGHVGVPRRIPDFHAVQVMATILGGLFNSRLQMNLRERKGYTYGVGAGYDMRRLAGPFAVRTAVNTAATVPAIAEALTELRRMRDERVTGDELRAARDYLVGVFPLRFETPGAVVGAIGGLFVHELPDDELAGYRGLVEAVTETEVEAAARAHLDPDGLAIVLVGDAGAVAGELEAAGFGPLEVVRDDVPAEADDEELGEGPIEEG